MVEEQGAQTARLRAGKRSFGIGERGNGHNPRRRLGVGDQRQVALAQLVDCRAGPSEPGGEGLASGSGVQKMRGDKRLADRQILIECIANQTNPFEEKAVLFPAALRGFQRAGGTDGRVGSRGQAGPDPDRRRGKGAGRLSPRRGRLMPGQA